MLSVSQNCFMVPDEFFLKVGEFFSMQQNFNNEAMRDGFMAVRKTVNSKT